MFNDELHGIVDKLSHRDVFRVFPMPIAAPCPIESDELSCCMYGYVPLSSPAPDGRNCRLDETLGNIPDDWQYDVGTLNKFVPESYYNGMLMAC